GEPAFSYASLWRDNRFSGRDRIGDANQISLGLTNRWLEADGFERQVFSIGQSFYFKDREVQLRGIDYRTRTQAQSSESPVALLYQYRYNRDWRFTSTFNWDTDQRETRSGSAMWHYQPADNPRKILNIGYRYRNETMRFDRETGLWTTNPDYDTPGTDNYIANYYITDGHDISFMWPSSNQWSPIGRWQRDYGRNRTVDPFGGFEYDSCCWKLRVINRYWIDYDETSLNPSRYDEPDRGIWLQSVFKGLGNVAGGSMGTLREESIKGYRQRESDAFEATRKTDRHVRGSADQHRPAGADGRAGPGGGHRRQRCHHGQSGGGTGQQRPRPAQSGRQPRAATDRRDPQAGNGPADPGKHSAADGSAGRHPDR